ncbi:hypothetical protein SLEP1_g57338 [Rubroshorea leprosula]|uniref:Uncharacterized protein n=1 Tax=Rubroshorea leprosula TaxID=152421 RepID=A0AAV5MQG4_9ROSI|nr:hypothetical protein SLEP1_g57338 [Rubroshorea leprosula]
MYRANRLYSKVLMLVARFQASCKSYQCSSSVKAKMEEKVEEEATVKGGRGEGGVRSGDKSGAGGRGRGGARAGVGVGVGAKVRARVEIEIGGYER